ncbi:MAG: hypothetical protein ABI863_24145 [Ginsengibacter sp.]
MNIRLSFSYVITFLLLLIVMLEFHESVHIVVGRFICGCWGTRDFNAWSLCDGCDKRHSFSWIATLAGPLFSFGLMWLGMAWLSSANSKKKALGFSLIFSNIPFGRISQVMMGSGDEMTVMRSVFKNNFSDAQMILICSVIVLGLGLPPIIKAFRTLTNRLSWLYILGFLAVPLLFLLIYILTFLNFFLNKGFLSATWIMGTPLLITLHTGIALIFLILFRKSLFSINRTEMPNALQKV